QALPGAFYAPNTTVRGEERGSKPTVQPTRLEPSATGSAFACRIECGHQRATHGFAEHGCERLIGLVRDLEKILHALAERGNARVMHTQAMRTKHGCHVCQQAGAIAADQS